AAGNRSVSKDLRRRCRANSPYPCRTQKRLRSATSNRSTGQAARFSRFSEQLRRLLRQFNQMNEF
ncbi:MAG: hypothetical protein AAFY05_21750, partial [Pseudomonadota bacterium]